MILNRSWIWIGIVLAVCGVSWGSEPCFTYSNSLVSLPGIMVKDTFAGPPNFESVAQGDEPEIHWVLVLSKPICVLPTASDTENVAEYSISRMQLNRIDYDQYRPLLGKPVLVTGMFAHAFTAFHFTDVMIEVTAIKENRLR